jgi:hypothetical protein
LPSLADFDFESVLFLWLVSNVTVNRSFLMNSVAALVPSRSRPPRTATGTDVWRGRPTARSYEAPGLDRTLDGALQHSVQ